MITFRPLPLILIGLGLQTAQAEIQLSWEAAPANKSAASQYRRIQQDVEQGASEIVQFLSFKEDLQVQIQFSADESLEEQGYSGWFSEKTPNHIWISGEGLSKAMTTGQRRQVVAHILHELVHAVYHAAKPNSDPRWLDEAVATWVTYKATHALYRMGYVPIQAVRAYLQEPSVCLDDFPQEHYDARYYGFSYLFASYLDQHFGGDRLWKQLFDSPLSGIRGLDQVMITLEENKYLPTEVRNLRSALAHFGLTLLAPGLPNRFHLTQIETPFALPPVWPSDLPSTFFRSTLEQPCLVIAHHEQHQAQPPKEFDPRAPGELWYGVNPKASPYVILWNSLTPPPKAKTLLGVRMPH